MFVFLYRLRMGHRLAFSGLSHILLPNLTVSGVEAALAYMVGPVRA